MSVHEISEPHKATIRWHLEESLAVGVPLDHIHRELLEIFAHKGKYTMQQITGTTSWLRSSVLGGKRVSDIDWDENDGETPEDVNFDNPEKNASREWHMANIVKHSTPEQRQTMHLSLLPGRNMHDFEALKKIGIDCRNALTFILGKDPKSVAQYIRNCRAKNVRDRRIGDMTLLLEKETAIIHGAYWDYFGQFCPAYVKNACLMPLSPDYGPIPLGFNLLKGREHDSTQAQMAEHEARQEIMRRRADTIESISDIVEIHFGDIYEDNGDFDIAKARNRTLQTALFLRVGTANTNNWILEGVVRELINQELEFYGKKKRYEEISKIERLSAFEHLMKKIVVICCLLEEEGFLARAGIHANLSQLASTSALAMVNRPLIHTLEEPQGYKSPHNDRPFTSYFGVLETRRKHYVKYIDAMEFLFKVMGHYLPVINTDIATATSLAGHLDLSTIGHFRCAGSGSAKEILFIDKNNTVAAHIHHDALLEASFALGISLDKTGDGVSEHEKRARATTPQRALRVAHMADAVVHTSVMPETLSFAGPIRRMQKRIGRNDLCYCGSGKKFKKCCMRRSQ